MPWALEVTIGCRIDSYAVTGVEHGFNYSSRYKAFTQIITEECLRFEVKRYCMCDRLPNCKVHSISVLSLFFLSLSLLLSLSVSLSLYPSSLSPSLTPHPSLSLSLSYPSSLTLSFTP